MCVFNELCYFLTGALSFGKRMRGAAREMGETKVQVRLPAGHKLFVRSKGAARCGQGELR